MIIYFPSSLNQGFHSDVHLLYEVRKDEKVVLPLQIRNISILASIEQVNTPKELLARILID